MVETALNKVALAQNIAVSGAGAIMELLEAEIGGALMGAFVAHKLMQKEHIEKWLEQIEKKLFYATGAVQGFREIGLFFDDAMWAFVKSQAMFVCVYKRYWQAKTFIRVEGNEKIPEKANVGECTLLEAPECPWMIRCNDMTEFYNR